MRLKAPKVVSVYVFHCFKHLQRYINWKCKSYSFKIKQLKTARNRQYKYIKCKSKCTALYSTVLFLLLAMISNSKVIKPRSCPAWPVHLSLPGLPACLSAGRVCVCLSIACRGLLIITLNTTQTILGRWNWRLTSCRRHTYSRICSVKLNLQHLWLIYFVPFWRWAHDRGSCDLSGPVTRTSFDRQTMSRQALKDTLAVSHKFSSRF